MKRILIILAFLTILGSASAWAQTQDTFFDKSDIDQIVVRFMNSKYWVVVLLNTKIGDFDGFYYYEFANLNEAVNFAWMFRKGRIKGVQHYQLGTGHHGSWGSKKISVITWFYLYSD